MIRPGKLRARSLPRLKYAGMRDDRSEKNCSVVILSAGVPQPERRISRAARMKPEELHARSLPRLKYAGMTRHYFGGFHRGHCGRKPNLGLGQELWNFATLCREQQLPLRQWLTEKRTIVAIFNNKAMVVHLEGRSSSANDRRLSFQEEI